MPTLDLSGNHCDLCGAARWKLAAIAVHPATLPPRLRRNALARLREVAADCPEDSVPVHVLTVPVCQPCAELLDLTALPEVDRMEGLAGLYLDDAKAASTNAHHVLAGLLERYERELPL